MSKEQSLVVFLEPSPDLGQLLSDVLSAAARAGKSEPGDRSDIARYESLCVQLEARAAAALADQAAYEPLPNSLPDGLGVSYAFRDQVGPGLLDRVPEPVAGTIRRRLDQGDIAVELRLPLEDGVTVRNGQSVCAPEPADVWDSEGARGREAVKERFKSQLRAVLARAVGGEPSQRRAAISPSGVNNRVITEVLRHFVCGEPATRVDAPVAYRDGSQSSHPFPLRCLYLKAELPTSADLELRVTLLSIRHAEMDPVVDGAWLRNAEVSRPRAAAQTDDIVYEASRSQLDQLTDHGRRSLILWMHQTGLDTAVVGFYRAVVMHLLAHPRSLSVVPMFYTAQGQPDEASSTLSTRASFVRGDPWTLG